MIKTGFALSPADAIEAESININGKTNRPNALKHQGWDDFFSNRSEAEIRFMTEWIFLKGSIFARANSITPGAGVANPATVHREKERLLATTCAPYLNHHLSRATS